MNKLTCVLIGLLILTAGCQPATVPTPEAAIPNGSVRVGDLDRTYLYYAPPKLPRNAPLVFVLHGWGSSSQEIREYTAYQFEVLAIQKGFVVVYPNGVTPNGVEASWNDCRKTLPFGAREQNVDDVAFVRALIERFRADYGINPSRVFATGYSNGGLLAFRLALELPDQISAIAAAASSLPVEEENICRASGKPVPALIMNGTEDPFLPYQGGLHGMWGDAMSAFRPTLATAEYFAKLNGQTSAPKTTRLPHKDASDPTSVDRTVWSDAGKPEVVLVTINGGGHVLPQSKSTWPPQAGRVTSDIDGPTEIWNFFSRQAPLK